MLVLIGLLLCVYLVFKGLEIFQIAYSNPSAHGSSIVIGVAALIASVLVAVVFAFFFLSAGFQVPQLPVR